MTVVVRSSSTGPSSLTALGSQHLNRKTGRLRGVMRAVSPVVGTVWLLALVVVLAGTVAGGLLPVTGMTSSVPEKAAIELSADASTNELTVVHRSGPPLSIEELTMEIVIDDQPLTQQPPVPFFSADGFVSGPQGAFNPAGDTTLRPGGRATVQIATTNTPELTAGCTVRVTFYDDETPVATAETTAT